MAKFLIAIVLGLLLGASVTVPSHGQQGKGATAEIESVDDSKFPEISGVVAVLDAVGKPLLGLRPDAISAKDQNTTATVTSLSTVQDMQMGIAVILALDVSGSMAGGALEEAKGAARAFVDSLQPSDQVGLLSFGDQVNLAQPLTADRELVRLSFSALQARGNTALYEAVADSVDQALKTMLPRRAIILLTDGRDFGSVSRVSRNDADARVAAGGVPFYVIGLGQDVDELYLGGLARATGGAYFHAPTPTDVPGIYAQISERLRSDYVITLRSTSSEYAPTRRLSLDIKTPGGIVHIEKTYTTSRPVPIPTPAPPPAPVISEAPQQPNLEPTNGGGSNSVLLVMAMLALAAVAAVVGWLRRLRNERQVLHDVQDTVLRASSQAIEVAENLPRPVERAKLRVVEGPNNGSVFVITEMPATIGSGRECQVQLSPDPALEERHARIWWRDGKLMLHQTARNAHTIVEGRDVSWASLEQGDKIKIGEHLLIAELRDLEDTSGSGPKSNS